MKTQISRDSHDKGKRYSGVYQQQGRMITDADLNELTDILKNRLETVLADLVGSGAPKHRGASVMDDPAGPALRPGFLYVDGIPGQVLPDATVPLPADPFPYDRQADLPEPPPLPAADGNYLIYADVWERPVTRLEDPDLADPGLNGADTTTRTRTVTQVKWLPEGKLGQLTGKGDALLTVRIREELSTADPCDPCATEIEYDRPVGNDLFRLEVHHALLNAAGSPIEITLKWSRENGAEQHVVADAPADFKGTKFIYEFFNASSESHAGNHIVTGGTFPVGAPLTTPYPATPETDHPDFPWVRRWDGYCILKKTGGVWKLAGGKDKGVALKPAGGPDATGQGDVHLSDEALEIYLETLHLTLALKDRSFLTGDFWLAPIRDRIHSPGDFLITDAPPRGIQHHYLVLASAKRSGGAWGVTLLTPEKARQFAFPPLTDLNAHDVGYTIPDCPDGPPTVYSLLKTVLGWPDPGDENPSVRTILDGLLCNLDAGKIPFGTVCEGTGLFSGHSETVQDALEALCDLSATHVGYTPDAGCADLAGVSNVKEALDELCLRPSGGGCRTVATPGANLTALINELVDKQKGEICICLPPGTYILEGLNLDFSAPHPIKLFLCGCGEFSRIILVGEPVVLNGLHEVSFKELSLETDPKSPVAVSPNLPALMHFRACRNVAFDRVTAAVETRHNDIESTLMVFEQTSRVAVENCTLLASKDMAKKLGELPQSIFQDTDMLTELFKIEGRAEFIEVAEERALELMKISPDERNKILSAIRARLDEFWQRLGVRERKAYERLIALLEAPDAESLASVLLEIWEETLSRGPGNALAFLDGRPETMIQNSRIPGRISLYGIAESEDPAVDMLELFLKKTFESPEDLKRLKDALDRLAIGPAAFRAVQSRLGLLQISLVVIRNLQDYIDEKISFAELQRRTPDIFSAGFLDNIVFSASGHFLWFDHLHLNGGFFEVQGGGRLGTAMGSSAIYVANRALPGSDMSFTNATVLNPRLSANMLAIRPL